MSYKSKYENPNYKKPLDTKDIKYNLEGKKQYYREFLKYKKEKSKNNVFKKIDRAISKYHTGYEPLEYKVDNIMKNEYVEEKDMNIFDEVRLESFDKEHKFNNKLSGIYCYKDTENNNKIVYIGLDSNIQKNQRDRDHNSPNRIHDQKINQILQKNPERYIYQVLEKGYYTKKELHNVEKEYIKKFKPEFNIIHNNGGKNMNEKDVSKNKGENRNNNNLLDVDENWGLEIYEIYDKKISDVIPYRLMEEFIGFGGTSEDIAKFMIKYISDKYKEIILEDNEIFLKFMMDYQKRTGEAVFRNACVDYLNDVKKFLDEYYIKL